MTPSDTPNNATLSTRVAERLRKARLSAGLTQAQMAVELGVTQPCIAYWESSRNGIGLDELERFAAVLGRSVEFFVTEREVAHA